ncbi:MAG: ABC transporter permease subunit [Fibromonadaceae bacterium]|jgi:microcin C transport system permease protein|nr:ABC transporter permease subunit [Fibromonadaceae bacterium]
MLKYSIKRILLIFPTMLGISFVCFLLVQLVPGGPVEEMISKAQSAANMKGGSHALTQEQIDQIKAYYGFDKPLMERYFTWLWKVLHLDFGNSFAYGEPAWKVISSRFPISLFFGVTSFFISYLICIPLGLAKAVKNGSKFDSVTSAFMFSGYVVPGYALGILLIVFLAGGSFLNLFPLGGLTSDNFEYLSLGGKILDLAHHLFLPFLCYILAEFAFLTLLMKNSVLEELGKDYMRTALAKGLSFKEALFKHALRNALIPLATRMSEIFTLMFAGALLIEKVFDIDGMGLLYYNAMMHRDYNVVLGIIMLSCFMAMLGRLFSDLLYGFIDPRIKLG